MSVRMDWQITCLNLQASQLRSCARARAHTLAYFFGLHLHLVIQGAQANARESPIRSSGSTRSANGMGRLFASLDFGRPCLFALLSRTFSFFGPLHPAGFAPLRSLGGTYTLQEPLLVEDGRAG